MDLQNLGFFMIYYLSRVIDWAFSIYMWFLIIRIVGSWFPSFAHHKIMRFLAFYTDPFLNLFRRIIPPIGGTLDLSPLLAFFALQILQRIILFILSRL
jgi:YggT family protein